MCCQGGDDGALDEVVHPDLRREVRARCLLFTRGGGGEDRTGRRPDLPALLGRNPCPAAVDREILLGQRERALQETLVDRAELTDAERSEVDGAENTVLGHVDQ